MVPEMKKPYGQVYRCFGKPTDRVVIRGYAFRGIYYSVDKNGKYKERFKTSRYGTPEAALIRLRNYVNRMVFENVETRPWSGQWPPHKVEISLAEGLREDFLMPRAGGLGHLMKSDKRSVQAEIPF